MKKYYYESICGEYSGTLLAENVSSVLFILKREFNLTDIIVERYD